MKYQVVIQPIGDITGRGNDRTVNASGAVVDKEILGVVDSSLQLPGFRSAVTKLDSANNFTALLLGLSNMTVVPSNDQKAALLLYFAAIEAGTNTSTVETAINAL